MRGGDCKLTTMKAKSCSLARGLTFERYSVKMPYSRMGLSTSSSSAGAGAGGPPLFCTASATVSLACARSHRHHSHHVTHRTSCGLYIVVWRVTHLLNVAHRLGNRVGLLGAHAAVQRFREGLSCQEGRCASRQQRRCQPRLLNEQHRREPLSACSRPVSDPALCAFYSSDGGSCEE